MSTTVTFAPPRPSSRAADNPEIPAPTMITSADWLDDATDDGASGCSRFGGIDDSTWPTAVGCTADEQPLRGKPATNKALIQLTICIPALDLFFNKNTRDSIT
jgi:hypothetical protein